MDFEDWIRTQLEPSTAPAPATSSPRGVQAFAWRRRGRFLQGLMAGTALTFLFLGASSSGAVQSLKLRVLPVEPQALPVTLLAGAPTVPDPESTAAAALAAGQNDAASLGSSSPGTAPATGAVVPFDPGRNGGGSGHPPGPGANGAPEPDHSPDSGHGAGGGGSPGGGGGPGSGGSPGGAPSQGPSPDGHNSGSGQPPAH